MKIFLLVAVFLLVSLAGFLFAIDEKLRGGATDWLRGQLGQAPPEASPPVPISVAVAHTATPTSIPTPDSVATIVAIVDTALPLGAPSPDVTSSPTPSPSPTATTPPDDCRKACMPNWSH